MNERLNIWPVQEIVQESGRNFCRVGANQQRALTQARFKARRNHCYIPNWCFTRHDEVACPWNSSARPQAVGFIGYAVDTLKDKKATTDVRSSNRWISGLLCRGGFVLAVDDQLTNIVEFHPHSSKIPATSFAPSLRPSPRGRGRRFFRIWALSVSSFTSSLPSSSAWVSASAADCFHARSCPPVHPRSAEWFGICWRRSACCLSARNISLSFRLCPRRG